MNSLLNKKSETIKKNSLPGPFSLLGQAWKLYRKNFKTLTVLSFIASISSLSDSIFSYLDGINYKLSPTLVVPVTIATTGVWFWGIVSMLFAIIDEKNGISIKEALIKGLKKLVPYTWLVFLSIFVLFGGFLFFIIPGIIFFVWFYMDIFVLAKENIGGMSALLRSREYIRGYFWSVASRILFIVVIFQIAFWVSSYIFKLFHLPLYMVLILNVIVSIISGIFGLIYGFLLYKSLKSIKGEITPRSSSKDKVFFVICGILGAIIPVILIMLYLLFLFVIPLSLNRSDTTQMLPFNYKLKDSPLVANRKIIQSALEKYYSDHGIYPPNLEDLVPEYLSSVPLNPVTGKQFKYVLQENSKKYKLCLGIRQDVCYAPKIPESATIQIPEV